MYNTIIARYIFLVTPDIIHLLADDVYFFLCKIITQIRNDFYNYNIITDIIMTVIVV